MDAPDSPSRTAAGGGRRRILTPTFVLAWSVAFLHYLVFYLLVTTMALYAVERFAASDTAAGLTSSSFVIGATVGRLFAGWACDAFGRRRVLLISSVVAAAASGAYLLAGALPELIAARTVHGAFYSAVSTAVTAIAQEAIPAERRAEGTGYLALSTTLATALGPALGLAVAGSLSHTWLFALALGGGLVALVLALVLPVPARPRPAVRPRLTPRSMVHPAVVPIGVFMVLVGLAYAGILTYLVGYARERGLEAGAGLFFLAYAAAMLLSRVPLGRLQDRRGPDVVVYPALASFVAAQLLLAAATADWHVVLAGALTGLGYGALMPAAQAVAVSRVRPTELGAGVSTLLLFVNLGLGIGPVALGGVVGALGYGPMFLLLSGGLVLTAGYYALLTRRRRRAGRPGPDTAAG